MIFFRKKEEVIDPYTMEKCNNCNAVSKRKFREGDYVFKVMEKCSSCNIGQMMITQIFGEVLK